MLLSPDQLVQQIHDSPTRVVMAVTGGGSRAIADLLEVSGASRTVLEAVVPYSSRALVDWLGAPPEEFCSESTARTMGMVAFERARQLNGSAAELAGVACTASLASDRPKRGPHRIHVALQTSAMTATWSLVLLKDRRSRAEEERSASRLMLNAVAQACSVRARLSLDLLEGERVEHVEKIAPDAWQRLMLGETETVSLGPPGSPTAVLFPGAFNPLHAGHRRMAEIACDMLDAAVAIEMSIRNVDKPPLDYIEIERRLAQFKPEQSVVLTRSATFEEKSRLFPGVTFVLGADTLQRIIDPRYYRGSEIACRQAVEAIVGRGCRFLIFGRRIDGKFISLADLDLPESLAGQCREVPADVFRDDVSSTAIRQQETAEGK